MTIYQLLHDEELYNQYKVTITTPGTKDAPGGKIISGLLRDIGNTMFTGTANFTGNTGNADYIKQGMDIIEATASNTVGNKFGGAAKGVLDTAIKTKDEYLISTFDSIRQFTGNSNISFEFQLLFINGYSKKPFKEIYETAMEMTYGKQVAGGYINPPYMYTPPYMSEKGIGFEGRDKSALDKTFSIQVGQWMTLNYLLCDGTTVVFSSETNTEGKPLTMTLSMKFSFYRDPTYEDVTGNFIRLTL